MQYFSTLDEAYGNENNSLEGTIVKKVQNDTCNCKCKGYQETNTFLLILILLILLFK